MKLLSLSSLFLPLLGAPAAAAPSQGLVVLRVDQLETISDGTFAHGVVLIEDGMIRSVGEDLPIEAGLSVLDVKPGWVVMPGFVNAATRIGLSSSASGESTPERLPTPEIYPGLGIWAELRETGVTTLGMYPPGTTLPGQAVVVQPVGSTSDEMVVAEGSYMLAYMQSTSSAKKMITKGFEQADSHEEKVEKAREKWEKDQEKKKKKSKSKSKKKDDDKDEEKDEKEDSAAALPDDKKSDDGGEGFEAPTPKESVQPFLDLRAGMLRALVHIRRSSDFLHFVDAIGDEEFQWDLWMPLGGETDFYEIRHRIAECGARVMLTTRTSLRPNTTRQINIARDFAEAGIPIVLTPQRDSIRDFKDWRHDVGALVRMGLDRQTALRAMTLEPAAQLGVDDRFGSVSVGKQADLLFFDGDPLEPSTRLRAVMIAGEIVYGEIGQ